MKLWFLVVVVVTGCYSPSVKNCTVSCSNPTDCAGGQVCAASGWCAAPDVSCEDTPDASMVRDSRSPDAEEQSLCELGCPNGTCAGGVCVIDCSAPGSCPNDLTCPPNIPCRVNCGDASCGHKVICGLASSCEVNCTGIGACADEIQCGKTPCDVSCAGANSCKRRVKCKESCACDLTCSGVGSCGETNECPLADACRLGEGCSSQLQGCDRCQ